MPLQSLLGPLGLESTQQLIKSVLDTIFSRMADGTQRSAVNTLGMDKVLVGSARDRLRDEFLTFDTTDATGRWDIFTGDSSGTYTNQNTSVGKLTGQTPSVTLGNGTTIALGGVSAGSRYLAIGAGLTNGAEIVVQSKDSFTLPLKAAAGLTISQKVNGQNIHFELVSVDDTGAVETDSTLPTASQYFNLLNMLGYRWYGTNQTTADKYIRGMGCPELISSNVATATIGASGTSPNFVPVSVFELNADMEQAENVDRLVDNTSAGANITKRTQNLPDPGKKYKLRFRLQNTATQTVSTLLRVHFARLLDTTRITVDMARHFGKTDASVGIPVLPAGNVTLNQYSSIGVEAMRTGRTNHTLSTTLAANASYTSGSTRLIGWSNSTDSAQRYACDIFCPTDCTVQREVSSDGVTWWPGSPLYTVSAGQGFNMAWMSAAQYDRMRVDNGAVAMSATPLRVITSIMLI